MKLLLEHLLANHAALRGHPVDYAKCGALALQRSGHVSPAQAAVVHDRVASSADIEWTIRDVAAIGVLDENRITEDGAEAVAITYVHAHANWIVKRRLQRGESADWLMRRDEQWMALEVSGTLSGDAAARLREKVAQVAKCSIPAERLAVVVAFDAPTIFAGSV